MNAQISIAEIIGYLPAITRFHWSKTQSYLIKQTGLIQECINLNSINPLYTVIDEMLVGEGYKTLLEYIAALRLQLADLYPIAIVDHTIEENLSLIKQTLVIRDPSNPICHFVHNAAETWFFYSLEMNIEASMICDDADRWIERERIKMGLGIHESRSEQANQLIEELIDNSFRGGELRIYFRAPLCHLTKQDIDFNIVHIYGRETFVAIVNSEFRTGYDITLPINLTIPFRRKDLYFDQAMAYSYIDDLYSKDIEHWNDNTAFIPLSKYRGE